jgi:hypothetical protein
MRNDDRDFIIMWLVGALLIFFLVWIVMFGYTRVLSTAYNLSKFIVPVKVEAQVEPCQQGLKPENYTCPRVVNNYGSQWETYNPQPAGLNK